MLSGVLTTESLTQAFRTLSQRRRHGVLEIVSTAGHFAIMFHNGRIVAAQNIDEPLVAAIANKLVDTKLLKEDVANAAVQACGSLELLSKKLVDGGVVRKEDFVTAKNVVQMDILYQLRHAKSGYFDFKSGVTDTNEAAALSVPPGQLLLDLLELETDEVRFEKEFRVAEADSVVINAKKASTSELSREESVIWKTLEVCSKLSEVRTLALLNEYQLREGLMGLLDKQYIEVGKAGNVASLAVGSHGQGLVGEKNGGVLSHLLDDLDLGDDDVDATTKAVPNDVENVRLASKSLATEPTSESFDSLIDEAVSLLIEDEADLTGNGFHASPGMPEAPRELAESNNGFAEHAVTEGSVVEPVDDSGLPTIEAKPLIVSPWLFIKQQLVQGNFRLLEDRMLNGVTIMLTFVFLVALGITVPKMIDRWFSALSLLTSPSSNIVIQLNE